MTKYQRQKARERDLVQRFADINPELEISNISISESPDILCDTVDGRCGIELVDFLFDARNAAPSLAIRKERRKLEEALKEEHQRRGLPRSMFGFTC